MNFAGTISNTAFNKLLPRAVGPLRAIYLQPHNLTTYERNINNTASIYLATHTPQVPPGFVPQIQFTGGMPSLRRSSLIAYRDTITQCSEVFDQSNSKPLHTQRGNDLMRNARVHKPNSTGERYIVDRVACQLALARTFDMFSGYMAMVQWVTPKGHPKTLRRTLRHINSARSGINEKN